MERKEISTNHNKSILCCFDGLDEKYANIFLEKLMSESIDIYWNSPGEINDNISKQTIYVDNSGINEVAEKVDMVCCFSCLDNYLRCLMGQNSIYVSKFDKMSIRIETILNDKDFIWCTACGKYAESLIRIDKENKNVEIMPMPYESAKKERLFSKILKVKESMYLVPEYSDYIAIYDIQEKKWTKVELLESDITYRKYSEACVIDGFVYFMPDKSHYYTKINCDSHEIEYIGIEFTEEMRGVKSNSKYEFCGAGGITVIDSDIYFYSRAYNRFMRFNTSSKKTSTVKKLEEKDFSYACVSDNNIFWMFTMTQNNKIIKYDIETDEITYYDNIPKIAYNRAPYHKAIKINNKIIFVPGLAEKAIVFDDTFSETCTLEALDIETYDSSKESWIYSDVDNDENNMYLFETNINQFVVYDIKKDMAEKYELYISEKNWYSGQANKVLQMLTQNIRLPKLSNNIIAEY